MPAAPVYTILLTDDDPEVHEILGAYLELAGFTVRHAYDGAAAVAAVRADLPDLLLLDVQMPELDGFQALELLRDGGGPAADVPTLFVTSLDRVNLKVKGLELGAEDYITKPFQKVEVLARIKAALRRTDRYRRAAGELSGDLADVGMAELLQTLELGRKSCRVELPAMDGEVVLRDGALTAASCSAAQGMDAVARLSFVHSGPFSVYFTVTDPTEEVEGRPIQAALMEAARQTDEAHARLGDLPEDATLSAGDNAAVLARLGDAAALLPLSVEDLVVKLPGGLVENAELVASTYTDGGLSAL